MTRIEDCRDVIAGLDGATRATVTRYMVERGMLPGDVCQTGLHRAMVLSRLCQADVVLCLLRLNTARSLRAAELVVGRPITRCPSGLRLRREAERRLRLSVEADERLEHVVSVTQPSARESGARRFLGAALYARLSVVRAGMTVSQMLARGVRRRDILLATRRGYLLLEGGAA